MKTHVKSAISRGKVDVFIAVNVMEDMQMRISVNHPVLEGYLSAMRSIASDYGVRDDISVTALSRLPDVFVVEKAEEDEEKLTQDILSVVDKALENSQPCAQQRVPRWRPTSRTRRDDPDPCGEGGAAQPGDACGIPRG